MSKRSQRERRQREFDNTRGYALWLCDPTCRLRDTNDATVAAMIRNARDLGYLSTEEAEQGLVGLPGPSDGAALLRIIDKKVTW